MLSARSSQHFIAQGRARAVGVSLRYAIGVGSVAIALGLAESFRIIYPDRPNLFVLLAAISISALFGGRAAGWIATLLSIAAAIFLLRPFDVAREAAWLLFFCCAAAIANVTSLRLRMLEREMALAYDDLSRRLGARSAELERTNLRLMEEARQRKSAEDSLREARKQLRRTFREVTGAELAASIAHEINQPISGLVTQGAAALKWLQRDPPNVEEACKSVRAAVRCGERATEVTRQLRRLMSKQPPAAELLQINEIVRHAVELSDMAAEFDLKNVVFDLAHSLPPVQGERIELELVIINLIGNAIESMEESEGPHKLTLRTRADGDVVRLFVEDTGPGVRDEHSALIFQPFHSTKRSGLGMGLPICRAVVAAHGGSITFKNRETGGASFEVRLPAVG